MKLPQLPLPHIFPKTSPQNFPQNLSTRQRYQSFQHQNTKCLCCFPLQHSFKTFLPISCTASCVNILSGRFPAHKLPLWFSPQHDSQTPSHFSKEHPHKLTNLKFFYLQYRTITTFSPRHVSRKLVNMTSVRNFLDSFGERTICILFCRTSSKILRTFQQI